MENDIKKIMVEHEDGSKRELEKGAVISFRYDEIDEEQKITVEMLNFKKKELEELIFAMVQVGEKMGLFDNL